MRKCHLCMCMEPPANLSYLERLVSTHLVSDLVCAFTQNQGRARLAFICNYLDGTRFALFPLLFISPSLFNKSDLQQLLGILGYYAMGL